MARAVEDLEDFLEADEPDEEGPEAEESEAPEAPLPQARGTAKCSPAMAAYFAELKRRCDEAYGVAQRARALGLEPEAAVEIPQAEDLAARVENLLAPMLPSVKGVAAKIRTLSADHNREEVSLLVAKEMARELAPKEGREAAVDAAVRTGLAILTEGVLVAPLEGVVGVKLGRNEGDAENRDYVAVFYAGPIRAAGGTAQALSVLIADVVRRELGIGRYIATEAEVERLKEEVPAYKQAQHLQYLPTAQEIGLIAKNCPVCIDGEGTEEEEVSGNRDLPRVETNRLRGGACLVMAEGLILKASKVQKHVKNLRIQGWEFLDAFLSKKKGGDEEGKPQTPLEAATAPSSRFLEDLVAGRPVLCHPSRKGGFRLRYGRARTAGIASTAIHPATMVLVDDFLAVGTQMKIERPGKATVVTPCDSIEGPLVLLDGGDLVQLTSAKEAQQVRSRVRRIVDLGEILVPFGEFAENNKLLLPAGYCREWWLQEAQRRLGAFVEPGTAVEAVRLSAETGLPLHPEFTLFWHDLTPGQVLELRQLCLAQGRPEGDALVLPAEAQPLLVELACVHQRRPPGELVVRKQAAGLLRCLGLEARDASITPREEPGPAQDALGLVSQLAGFPVRAKGPWRVGARMGRPEKAAERKMSPPVHSLFPLGHAGGLQRLIKDAAAKGTLEVEVGLRSCQQCGATTFENRCACGAHTVPRKDKPARQRLELHELLQRSQQRLGLAKLPETIKGVQGLISKGKTPEPLEKGLLRAKHDVSVFKDGTVRFDATDVPLTHFRPREAHVGVARLRELGYTHDTEGQPLERDDQMLELKVQDVIVPRNGLEYLQRTASFVDELLERFYQQQPYYNARRPEDLVGHLVVGLAPHTSGGVLGRLIGWTRAQAGFAHPYWHAAKRRNADGDEDAFMLLLDGLLNFSRSYLPEKRGGLMDAPLVLTTRLDPSEVDKEAHNLDVGWLYPLEFYEATQRCPPPKEVEKLVDTVAKRLGTEAQYEGLGFTHDTADIADGPAQSAYKTLPTMMDKMDGQFRLAELLRAVDPADVAARVIEGHFLRDLQGNLKKFSKQKVRCVKCNAKYRRPPLKGACLRCGGNLTMTVHHASVIKYLEVSKRLAAKYNVKPYTRQRLEVLEQSVNSLFQSDKVKKTSLKDFFGS